MPRYKNFLITAAALFALTGCGGGGGSDPVITPGETDAPKQVSFGIVKTETKAVIKIKNAGLSALIIKDINVTGSADFNKSIENDNCTNKVIAGYGSCDFTVIFSPYASSESGMSEASVTITSDSSVNPSETIALYGYGEGSWKTAASAGTSFPEARYGHSAASTDSLFYIFGGIDGAGFKNDLWSANGSGEWLDLSSGSEKPEARAYATLLNIKGDIYLFGGKSRGAGGAEIYFNDVWHYSPFSKVWERFTGQTANGPEADKTCSSNAVTLDNYIYSIAPDGDGPVKIYRLDVGNTARVWETVNAFNAPVLTGNLKANSVIDGKIYVFGLSKTGAEELWVLDPKLLFFEKTVLPEGQEMPAVGNAPFSAVQMDGGFALFADNGTDPRMWSYTPDEGFREIPATGWITDQEATALTDWAGSYFNKHIIRFGGRYITASGTINTGEYIRYE